MLARSSSPSAWLALGISSETGCPSRRASIASACAGQVYSERLLSADTPGACRPSLSPVWGACSSLIKRSLAALMAGTSAIRMRSSAVARGRLS